MNRVFYRSFVVRKSFPPPPQIVYSHIHVIVTKYQWIIWVPIANQIYSPIWPFLELEYGRNMEVKTHLELGSKTVNIDKFSINAENKSARIILPPTPLDQGCPLQIWSNCLGIRATIRPAPNIPKPYPHCQIRPPNFGALIKGHFGALVSALWTSSDQSIYTR